MSIHFFSKFSKNDINSPSFSLVNTKSMYVFLPECTIPCFETQVGDCIYSGFLQYCSFVKYDPPLILEGKHSVMFE